MAKAPGPVTHENDNRDQDDADSQAQSVADDASGRTAGDPSEDSDRGGESGPGAVMPDDVPDLVETMNQMVTSGRLDYGAFAGEPAHDDEPEMYGGGGDEDDDDA